MKRYKMDILGISEMRWTGSGKMESEGIYIYYSGCTKHERGVGIMLTKEMSRAVLTWEPVSDRIITIRLQSRYTKITLVQVYQQEKDYFFS